VTVRRVRQCFEAVGWSGRNGIRPMKGRKLIVATDFLSEQAGRNSSVHSSSAAGRRQCMLSACISYRLLARLYIYILTKSSKDSF